MATRPVDSFVDKLRPVAIGRLGVEPVGKQKGRPANPGVHDHGLDEVGLDRLAGTARCHPDVSNENAVPILAADDLERGRPGTRGGCV